MNSHPARFEELERRLLGVEKQNRLLKQLGAALAIMVTSLVVMGQAPSKKTVEANEFILRDESGSIRARLFITAKSTTNMNIPGISTPVPVTFNPKATLTLYDQKEQVSGIVDADSISFFKSHVLLAGGVLTLGDQSAAVVISPYSLGLFDELPGDTRKKCSCNAAHGRNADEISRFSGHV